MELKEIPYQTLDEARVGRIRRHKRRAEIEHESTKMEEVKRESGGGCRMV